MKYQIKLSPTKKNKPYIFIDENDPYWYVVELNSCSDEYILKDVLPNLGKVMSGELSEYEFGFDATIIDFQREKSVINYGYFEGAIEVASEDIYKLSCINWHG